MSGVVFLFFRFLLGFFSGVVIVGWVNLEEVLLVILRITSTFRLEMGE